MSERIKPATYDAALDALAEVVRVTDAEKKELKATIAARDTRIAALTAEVAALRERCVTYHGPKPIIACLCGSTRFIQTFFNVGWALTLEGKIVLSVGVCKHAEDHGGEALGQEVADRFDELHKRKIDLADEVWILNVGGYIGESTRSELEYARKHGKRVIFLEKESEAAHD